MRRTIPLLVAAAAALQVHAADWQNVATDKGARIDIDRASLLPSDPGKKIVWMRLVMAPEDATREGYHTLKALNRYDCRANRYATIKRVYLREDMTVMREERVESERENAVQNGTADAKLFHEVCQPPTTGDLKKVALQAADAAQKAAKPAGTDAKDTKDPKKAEKVEKAEAQHGAAGAKTAVEPGKDAEAKKPLVDIRPSIRHADLKAEAEASKAEAGDPKHAVKPAVAKADGHAPAKPDKPAATHAEPRAALAEARAHAEKTPPRVANERKAVLAELERARPAHASVPTPAPTKMQLALASPAHGPSVAAPAPAKDSHADTHTGTGHDVHWTYDGETGPDNWGKLKPEWKTCSSGDRQSPIDIRDGVRVDQEPVRFYYKPSGFRVIDNGHTVQVNVSAGNRIVAMGREFELVQFHFHRPSEERVNGKLYDMVAHLVHKDREGRLAVVALLMNKGAGNPNVQTVWNHLPLERNVEYPASTSLDVEAMMPEDRAYFSYMGSLTTPPCTEGVLWIVMRNPVDVSAEQITAFARLYPSNARPIQQVAGRLIKESR
jgi:carbonic anhydrase